MVQGKQLKDVSNITEKLLASTAFGFELLRRLFSQGFGSSGAKGNSQVKEKDNVFGIAKERGWNNRWGLK